MTAVGLSDAELVGESLGGNRDAFGQIVTRYQSLVCSLAYSATGSLGQSEDLAQETFITAWKHLRLLREPTKLRAWLCGIARNRISHCLRREGREPLADSEPLEAAPEASVSEPLPSDYAISQEEAAILWRALEALPQLYREPLVLFYREHQSVSVVAAALDLTEEAAKQRLSRGRKILQEEVLAFVEGALERTNPGKAFTLGVLAALPLLSTSAKAAAISATAAKGSALAKSAGVVSVLSAVLSPLLMFVGLYFGYRLDRSDTNSPERLGLVRRYYRTLVIGIALFFAAVLALVWGGSSVLKSQPTLYIGLLGGLGVIYLLFVLAITAWMRRTTTRIRQSEVAQHRPAPIHVPLFEYRSRWELLGLPLIHIRIRGGLERGPVKGWIAIGDAAVGALFAAGGCAIAPVSFGGFAVGLLPLGGFALGPVALGGFSLGIWSLGGFAVGWQAFGGCAVAWNGAVGGAAWAHDFALGAMARAAQVNNAAAELYSRKSWFFQIAETVSRQMMWLNLLWLLPLALWGRAAARARR